MDLKSSIAIYLKTTDCGRNKLDFSISMDFNAHSCIKRRGSSRFKLYRDQTNALSPYVSWIRRSVVATFSESFRSYSLILHRARQFRKVEMPATACLFLSFELSSGCVPRGTNVRHKRERGAARRRGTTSMIHREGEKEGRSRRGGYSSWRENGTRTKRYAVCASMKALGCVRPTSWIVGGR